MVSVGLLLSLCHLCCLLLFGFQALHDLFSLLILVDHDVADTEIGNDDSSQTKHVVSILIDDGFIIADSFVISLQHKENMRHIELPCLVVSTELSTLSEKFFNHRIVLPIPVDLCLRHQHWNILLEAFIELFERLLDSFVILG